MSSTYAHLPRATSSHLQLAAQVPSHWLETPAVVRSTEIAVRKVVYRALLEPVIEASTTGVALGGSHSSSTKRLGRLPDSAYDSFGAFVDRAMTKLGLPITLFLQDVGSDELIPATATTEPTGPESLCFAHSQRQLEVLHTLRSILGPAIESTIILDRFMWLREALGVEHMDGADEAEHDAGWKVEIVGLFDQAVGSARNLAITISPSELMSI